MSVLLAELEIWHTRPLTPTRRLSLGHMVLCDPAPGFGGLLLGAIIARHAADVDDDLLPDTHRLLAQIQRGERVVPATSSTPIPSRPTRIGSESASRVRSGRRHRVRSRCTRKSDATGVGCDLRARASVSPHTPRTRTRYLQVVEMAWPAWSGVRRSSRRIEDVVATFTGRSACMGTRRPGLPGRNDETVEACRVRAVPSSPS